MGVLRMPRLGGFGGSGGRFLWLCGWLRELRLVSELSDWVQPSWMWLRLVGKGGTWNRGESTRSRLARKSAV